MFFYLIYEYLQTEQFANIASSYVQKYVAKKHSVEVEFSKIKLGLFPPSTQLDNVKLKLKNGKLYKSEMIKAKFGISDIFTKTTSIGELEVKGTTVKIKSTKDRSNEFDLKKTFNEDYRNFINELPVKVKKLKLSDSLIYVGSKKIYVNTLKAGLYQSLVTLDLSIENLLNFLPQDYDVQDNVVNAVVQISPEYIRFKNVEISEGISRLTFFGKVLYEKGEFVLNNFNIEARLFSQRVIKYIPKEIREVLGSIRTNVNANLVLSGPLKNPEIKSDITFDEFYSKMWTADGGQVSFVKDKLKNNLKVMAFSANKNGGSVNLTEPFELVSNGTLSTNIITKGKLSNLYTNHILNFLPSLDPFKAEVSGEYKVELKDIRYLSIIPSESASINKLRLNFGNGNVVNIPKKLEFRNESKIDIDFENDVKLNILGAFGSSLINLNAVIGEKLVVSEFVFPKFFSEDFGAISGAEFEGQGEISGRAKSNYDEIELFLNTNFKDFKFLNTNFGNIYGPINLDLKRFVADIGELNGQFRGIKYKSKGRVNFESKKLDLGFKVEDGTLSDFQLMTPYVFKPIEKYLENVSMSTPGDIRVYGGMDLDNLKVSGTVDGQNLTVIAEDFERASFDFRYDKDQIYFPRLSLNKAGGRLDGSYKYTFKNSKFEYQATMSAIKLFDFNFYRVLGLGYSGDMYGELYGSGTVKDFATRSQLRVTNGSIGASPVKDSLLTVYNNGQDLFATGNLIGERVTFDSYINLNEKDKKNSSYLKSRISTNNIKEIFGLYSKHNVLDNKLNGYIYSNFEMFFNPYQLEKLDLNYKINRALFERRDVRVLIRDADDISIAIENGLLKKWDIAIKQSGVSLTSVGKGRLFKDAQVNSNFFVNGNLVELLHPKILRATGNLKARHSLNINSKKVKSYFENTCDNCSLNIESITGVVSNIQYTLIVDDNKMVIKKFNGKYGGGDVLASGNVLLKFPFPEINVKTNLRDVRIPLMKKSNVVVNSDLELEGSKIPYVLKGDISLVHGDMLDELEEIAKSAMSNSSYQRFVPKAYVSGGVGLVNNDFNINIVNPLKIKNSLLDLNVNGGLAVKGTLLTPHFNGEARIVGSESKITFKGHEFILSKGRVKFIDTNRKEKPEINIEGRASINEYNIGLVVSGSLDNIVVDMNSSPALSQENILSLLTIGVTNDVSRSLGERERQSVTTLSIGSLIVDQLKINQNLNDSLGLRLSVQPEISESDTSLLEGRTDGSQGATSNVRSSTKIKIQKKINKKVDLSVSSTVGGTSTQKQQMNLNYNINKKWSIEGTYEIKSGEEVDSDSTDSKGVDLKYRWSF
ncbi:MAG: hypothetical protein GY909_12290 [Oligoflexia bacterium]|nr:hypothetical protein [Oligoflexia bacterium]